MKGVERRLLVTLFVWSSYKFKAQSVLRVYPCNL